MFDITRGPGDLDFVTWTPDDTRTDAETAIVHAYRRMSSALSEHGSIVLQERVFGRTAAAPDLLRLRRDVLGEEPASAIPPTFVEGLPCHDGAIAGIHVIAARPVSPSRVSVLDWRGTPCGRRVEGVEASYIGLADVARLLDERIRDAETEARDALNQTIRVLEAQSWSFLDVRRTWFYLDDILSWYDAFNRARNTVFSEIGLLNGSAAGMIPASTGIRGRNPRGHRCTLDILAFRSDDESGLEWSVLRNPLQNEAHEYGSAFSRGLVATTPRCRYYFVSGTASIDEAGATVHPGDFDLQAERTLDNIESLLASRGATLRDICQATAFVKHRDGFGRLEAILRKRGLADLPMVFTVDDICREDLLVEIDATAVVAETGNSLIRQAVP